MRDAGEFFVKEGTKLKQVGWYRVNVGKPKVPYPEMSYGWAFHGMSSDPKRMREMHAVPAYVVVDE